MDQEQPKKRIGEILVDQHLITRAQLEQALERQRATKEFLGGILVGMGAIKPEVLLEALSEQFHLPHEPLTVDRVDWTVPKQFPASVLSDGKCFPFRADAESVAVAIANPLDVWSLSAIEHAAGFRKVQPVLVLEAELRTVLQTYRQQVVRSIEGTLKDGPHHQAH